MNTASSCVMGFADIHPAMLDLLAASGVGIWGYEVPTGQASWNAALPGILGRTDANCPHGAGAWLALLHPADAPTVRTQVLAALEVDNLLEIDVRVLQSDGVWRRVRVLGRVIDRDAGGQPVRVAGTLRDVTERYRSKEGQCASDQRKTAFLATLGHELRNPLAAIRNAVSILEMTELADPVQTRACALIDRQIQHLVRLIDDLLDISRIDRGVLELRRELLEIGELLEQVLTTARPQIAAAGHRLDRTAPGGAIWVTADPERLIQVFRNLLDNACKYSDPGGSIQVGWERVGDAVVVRIRDSGIGLAPEDLDQVLEPFSQSATPSLGFRGGLGIGLVLARQLVELHGGHLTAHSEGPGRGSEFQVRLPTADPTAGDTARSDST